MLGRSTRATAAHRGGGSFDRARCSWGLLPRYVGVAGGSHRNYLRVMHSAAMGWHAHGSTRSVAARACHPSGARARMAHARRARSGCGGCQVLRHVVSGLSLMSRGEAFLGKFGNPVAGARHAYCVCECHRSILERAVKLCQGLQRSCCSQQSPPSLILLCFIMTSRWLACIV